MVNIGFLYMSPPQLITAEKKICQVPWIMNCLLLDGFLCCNYRLFLQVTQCFEFIYSFSKVKCDTKISCSTTQWNFQEAVNRCGLKWTSPSNLSRTQNDQWSDWDILDFNIYFHNSVNMFNIGYRLCSAFAALPTAGPAKMNYTYDQCDNIILFQQTTNSGHHTW